MTALSAKYGSSHGSADPSGPVRSAESADLDDGPRLPTETLARPKMRDGVIRAILEFIVQHHLDEGFHLPSEGEMVRHFGASRTVVREALRVLEEKRVLRVLHGRGTVVTSRDEWDILDEHVLAADLRYGLNSRITDELVRTRMWVEEELAAEAALQATEDELGAIAAQLELMRGFIADPDTYSGMDIEYHKLISHASHNRVGISVQFALANAVRLVRRNMHGLPGASARAHRDHEIILESLQRHDSEAARAEVRRHIQWGRELWRTMMSQEGDDTRRLANP